MNLVTNEFYLLNAKDFCWLEERNHNIPSETVDIFDVFADFKFVNELREEMERVNQAKSVLVLTQ